MCPEWSLEIGFVPKSWIWSCSLYFPWLSTGQKMFPLKGMKKGVSICPSFSGLNQHLPRTILMCYLQHWCLACFHLMQVWLPYSAIYLIIWLVFPHTPIINSVCLSLYVSALLQSSGLSVAFLSSFTTNLFFFFFFGSPLENKGS